MAMSGQRVLAASGQVPMAAHIPLVKVIACSETTEGATEQGKRLNTGRRRSCTFVERYCRGGCQSGTVAPMPRRPVGKRSGVEDGSWLVHGKAANGEGSIYPRSDGR
jgi:hypothetical protein